MRYESDRITLAATEADVNAPIILFGNGSPETFVVAEKGSLYIRKDGGAGTTFYVKESGSLATGWVGK